MRFLETTAYAIYFSFSNINYFVYFSIAAGSDRRLFRYICDSLRIRQKLTATMTNEVAVQVLITRSEFTELRPHVMFLTDLLKLEGNKGEQRQIDGQPYRWKETIEPLLKSLSPQSMQSVVVSLLHSMRYSPSPSWAFLYAQTLIDSGVSFPRSMLHALLSHCNARNDPYGAVEVLHLGESIRKLDIVSNEGTGQQETAWFPLESQVGGVLNFRTLRLGSMPLRVSKFGIIDQSLETRDLLTDKDWRRAVTIAWHGHLGLPRQAFVGNFTEAIGLMRSAGKSLDESTSKIMMRFLVATQIGSPNTRQIFDSVNENKGIGVSHVECIAISRYIEFRLRAK